MSHSHELFYRTHNEDGTVTLTPFADRIHPGTEPGEDWIKLVDGLAKEGKLTEKTDAILYKIDGKCEYMISREFYLWPNTTDNHAERRKNTSKGQARARSSSDRGNERSAQRRPA